MSPFAIALAAGRIAVGVGAWVAPGLTAKAFGQEPDPRMNYVSRLFGARDVALAVGVLTTTGATQRSWLQLGLACDALDVAAAALSGAEGSMRPQAAGLAGGAAVGGAVLGALALREA